MTIRKNTWLNRVRENCDPRYAMLRFRSVRKRVLGQLKKAMPSGKQVRHSAGAATIGAAAFLSSFAAIPVNDAVADVVTIDFETPDVPNTVTLSSPFGEDGFTISNTNIGILLLIEDDSFFFAGSQAITTPNLDSEISVSIDDPINYVFTPKSIDVAEFSELIGGATITFTGVTNTGLVVTDTLTTDGEPDLFGNPTDTLTFSSSSPLQSLTSLSFNNVAPGLSFDNIVTHVSAVPEPTSGLLLGVLASGLLMRRRRNRNATAPMVSIPE